MIYNPLIQAAELIESVVAQKLTAEAALKVWPFALNKKFSILAKSWTSLRHFADDEDLHKVDLPYFISQQEQLKKYAVELHKEADALPNIMKPIYESINAICPVYAASERQRAVLIGTATLLDFGTARFMVTAAHVQDWGKEHEVALYTTGDGKLEELPQQFCTTDIPASGKRSEDRLDFAFIRLDDDLANKIAKSRFFLPFGLIDSKNSLFPNARYMFSGYPISREKADYGNKMVKPQRYSYTGVTASLKRISDLGLKSSTHIVVEFDREKVLTEDGQKACFPLPTGMSGGAIWQGKGDYNLWLKETAIQLVGIGIEFPEKENVLIGVRIGLILKAISEVYPNIFPVNPKK